VTKEWIAFQDIEAFIAPIYHLRPRIGRLDVLFGRLLNGLRVENPENQSGFVTKCAGSDSPIPTIQGTLSVWKNPKQLQEQFNWRLYEIIPLVGPAKAKFPSFLGQFATEEPLVVTVGSAPVDSCRLKPWPSVVLQEERRMARTGSESADKTDQGHSRGLIHERSRHRLSLREHSSTRWRQRNLWIWSSHDATTCFHRMMNRLEQLWRICALFSLLMRT
jgi:hypothetical protein